MFRNEIKIELKNVHFKFVQFNFIFVLCEKLLLSCFLQYNF